MKIAPVIECTPENVGKLVSQINELKMAIWHLVYRNHPYSPKFCDGCALAQIVLDKGD